MFGTFYGDHITAGDCPNKVTINRGFTVIAGFISFNPGKVDDETPVGIEKTLFVLQDEKMVSCLSVYKRWLSTKISRDASNKLSPRSRCLDAMAKEPLL